VRENHPAAAIAIQPEKVESFARKDIKRKEMIEKGNKAKKRK
jgi:hypothetical protein